MNNKIKKTICIITSLFVSSFIPANKMSKLTKISINRTFSFIKEMLRGSNIPITIPTNIPSPKNLNMLTP